MVTVAETSVWMLRGQHPDSLGEFLLDVCRTREAAEERARDKFARKGWRDFRYTELRRRVPSPHFRPGD